MTTFASGTDTLTRDALSVLQPGFTGTTAPDWLLRRLGRASPRSACSAATSPRPNNWPP